MRKLPIYFLIDVSDSMAGEPLRQVHDGLETITHQLRSDPYALETAFLAIIAFAGKAKLIAPLAELPDFRVPPLPLGPGTNLGAGLSLLMDCMDKDLQATTREKKGDWKAVIFLFTDGAPTDDPARAIARWNRDYRKKGEIIAVTIDGGGDVPLLESFCATVLNLKETSPEAFQEFFKWVSASLQVTSMAVSEQRNDGPKLAEHGIILEKAKPDRPKIERFANLPIRCSKKKDLWLAKYAASSRDHLWELVGAYPVDDEIWSAFSATGDKAKSIDLADVDEIPRCPVCRADSLVHCGHCNHLSCLDSSKAGTCPWCGVSYQSVASADHINVDRSRG